jgi:hypothetical protein
MELLISTQLHLNRSTSPPAAYCNRYHESVTSRDVNDWRPQATLDGSRIQFQELVVLDGESLASSSVFTRAGLAEKKTGITRIPSTDLYTFSHTFR